MNKEILWLPGWYPSLLDLFAGDFIQRHAEAVSFHEDVRLIYVVRDKDGSITSDILINETIRGRLSETIIYYYVSPRRIKLLEKFLSEKIYRKLYKQAVLDYIEKKGIPRLTHVHVGMKPGVIALWLKRKFSIPYLVTEHWTGFLEEAEPNFRNLSAYMKATWKKVMKYSSGVSAVSAYLSNALQHLFSGIKVRVIPNVVNTRIFFPNDTIQKANLSFIHISSLEHFKNPVQLLHALKIVLNTVPDVELKIFGAKDHTISDMIKKLGLENHVSVQAEIPQNILAEHIRQSRALILYSRYETFGCVIIEANACGVPVIVSDLPVFHETITEGVNGFFAKANNPGQLAARILDILKNSSSFNGQAIAEMTASKYSYQVVGKQFSDWYQEMLNNQ